MAVEGHGDRARGVLNHEPIFTMIVSSRRRTKVLGSGVMKSVTAHEPAERFDGSRPMDKRTTRLTRAGAALGVATSLLRRDRRFVS